MKDWSIEGEELANHNCNFGCPCQFSVRPTDGTCEAVAYFRFDKGHYGDVSLDGVKEAGVYKWPGPIHEGGIVETEAMPIPNIVTGDPHRISIALPHGFEFGTAEMAKGESKTTGRAVQLHKNTGTHAHIASLHLTGQGRVAA